MKGLFQFNNWLLFGIGISIPFINAWSIGGHNIGTFQQIGIFLLAYYIFISGNKIGKNPARHAKSRMSEYLLYFCMACCISLCFLDDPSTGFEQIYSFIQFLVIYLILSEIMYYREAVEWLLKGLLVGFGAAVFIAFMQFTGHTQFNLYTEDQLNTNTKLDTDDATSEQVRIWGPFGNSLTFSIYLSVTGVVFYCYYNFFKKKRLLAWILTFIAVVTIVITVSRMAIVTLFISILLVELLVRKTAGRIRILLITVVSCVLLATAFLSLAGPNNPFIERTLNADKDFKSGRLELWGFGYRVFVDRPLWGSGPGNLNQQLNKHGWFINDHDILTYSYGHVENYYLSLLFTFGLIPFIFYAGFVYTYMKSAFRLFKLGLTDKYYSFLIGLLPALVCFFMNNLINPVLLSDARIQMLFIVLLALVNAYSKVNKYKMFTENLEISRIN